MNLAAYDNQNINGKVWFFNDTECSGTKSDWKKRKSGNSTSIGNTAFIATNPLTTNDNGAEFIAFLQNSSATTSGTMSSSETWFCPVTLTGNLTVPGGVGVIIESGVTVNLNGYSILLTGGTLTKKSGATINGLRAYLKSGSAIKAYCGSVQTACTNAATNDVVEIQSGTFSENVSVSGKSKLTIKGKGTSQSHLAGTLSIYNATTTLDLVDFRCNAMYLNGCQQVLIGSATSPLRITTDHYPYLRLLDTAGERGCEADADIVIFHIAVRSSSR